MPSRIPKACRVRGCRHTTTDPSGYCESHKSEGWKQYKPGQSRHQRGYRMKRQRDLNGARRFLLLECTELGECRQSHGGNNDDFLFAR